MSQQSRIDFFFPTIKGNNGNSHPKIFKSPKKQKVLKKTPIKSRRTPKKMVQSPESKRRLSESEEEIRKVQKLNSPSGRIVKIYPSPETTYCNENSTQNSQPFSQNSTQFSGNPTQNPLSFSQNSSQNCLTFSESPQKSQNAPSTQIFQNSQTSIFSTFSQTPGKSKPGSFTPKKSPRSMSGSRSVSQFSPRKLFQKCEIPEVAQNAIENLNMVKQGAIGPNNFDLKTIYETGRYEIQYNSMKTDLVDKFELKDVIFPRETHADHLFNAVADVFSNVINCGYFSEKEVDFVFSSLCMSAKAQMLLARLLKRKRSWHRNSSIQYPEIAKNLDDFFKELVQKGFCDSKTEEEEVSKLLKMLKLEEVRSLCQKLKVDHRGSKTSMMERLLVLNNKQKTWFVGAKSPSSVLKSSIKNVLGPCVRLSNEAISVFDRIFFLLFPCQDPAESVSDLFLLLTRVKTSEIMFPTTPKERFPIFKDRDQLLRYVDARNTLKELIDCVENKDWESVRNIGHLAYERLLPYVENEERDEEKRLPSHVLKFLAPCVWAKVLSSSIDAFKKTPETIEHAVNYLNALIKQNKYGTSYIGRWYRELSLIEMHHRKDLQTSAQLTLDALSRENLTEVDVKELLERAKKLMRRKTGLPKETKLLLSDILEKIQQELPGEFDIVNEIEAHMVQGNMTGSKSTWKIDFGEDKGYTKVEFIALRHYQENGFPKGFHCEGSLPLSLFTILFWNELFSISVPGAFVCSYQESPLDLFTSKFFENRQEQIESKIKFIRALDDETFGELFADEYIKYRDFKSMISTELFENEQHVKEVAKSLGTTGVAGICEKLASNFRLWKSGFPDLFVWNPLSNECKIIEVKGPGDSLSSKQKLWLQYLQQIGLSAEVCIVKDKKKSVFKY